MGLSLATLPQVPHAVAEETPTVVEQRVSATADDAEESPSGSVSRGSSDLELVNDGSNQTVGIRFASVAVPAGATITNAYVQFAADETNIETTNLTIRGEKSTSAGTFTGTSFNVSSRPTTSASASWSPPAWNTVGQAGTDQRTTNLSSVIQEIIGQGGWASGNPMALIITGTGHRTAESYNGSPTTAPLIHIEYTTGIPGVGIANFAASPTTAGVDETVTFSWSVSDGHGDPVTCTLDVDDNGSVEYTISNCQSTATQNHSYASAGSKTARLTASNANGSAEATTGVTVTAAPPPPGGTVVDQRVTNSDDDAEESPSGSVSRGSSDLELVNDGSNQTVGIRFANIDVPSSANITNAWIQFTVDETNTETTNLTIRGEDTDNSVTFGSSSFNISSRPTTSASASWSPPPWNTVGQAGTDQRTTNLSSVIQEIVDRAGWNAGQALSVIITGTGHRTAESYNGSTAAAPLLHIEYTQNITINSFTHTPERPAPGEQITFSWSVTHATGAPVSCTIDVDDNGSADYTIPNCLTTTSQTHTYTTEGFKTARLTATAGTDTARGSTVVNVLDPQTVVIAAAGDIACDPTSSSFNGGVGTSNNCKQLATSDLVLGIDPNAVLILGDNQYEDGTIDQFNGSYDLSWGRFKDITYPSVGNHEYNDPAASTDFSAAGYYEYFGAAAGDPTKGYYSFDLGNWHMIALNSNCSKVGGCSAGSPQETWLRADLAAHPSECIMAYWHHPLFSSGAIGNITWTEDFWTALQEFGADVVLVGHDHHYERFGLQDANGNADPNGIREFIVGSGGRNHTSVGSLEPNSQMTNDDTYGVLKMSLRPDSYEWQFVPIAGESFSDTGTASCS